VFLQAFAVGAKSVNHVPGLNCQPSARSVPNVSPARKGWQMDLEDDPERRRRGTKPIVPSRCVIRSEAEFPASRLATAPRMCSLQREPHAADCSRNSRQEIRGRDLRCAIRVLRPHRPTTFTNSSTESSWKQQSPLDHSERTREIRGSAHLCWKRGIRCSNRILISSDAPAGGLKEKCRASLQKLV
jgi:hypothetical protein